LVLIVRLYITTHGQQNIKKVGIRLILYTLCSESKINTWVPCYFMRTDGRTDRHDEIHIRFTQFCGRTCQM